MRSFFSLALPLFRNDFTKINILMKTKWLVLIVYARGFCIKLCLACVCVRECLYLTDSRWGETQQFFHLSFPSSLLQCTNLITIEWHCNHRMLLLCSHFALFALNNRFWNNFILGVRFLERWDEIPQGSDTCTSIRTYIRYTHTHPPSTRTNERTTCDGWHL